MAKPVYKKAGLTFPAHKVGKRIRKQMSKRHCQKHVDIYVTAVAEHCIKELLRNAADHVEGKRKSINSADFSKTLNDDSSSVYGVFPKIVAGVY